SGSSGGTGSAESRTCQLRQDRVCASAGGQGLPLRGDVPCDAPRVAARAADEHRRERVKKRQADEVEPGGRARDAAVLHGVAVVAEVEWEVDPAVVGLEARAP